MALMTEMIKGTSFKWTPNLPLKDWKEANSSTRTCFVVF